MPPTDELRQLRQQNAEQAERIDELECGLEHLEAVLREASEAIECKSSLEEQVDSLKVKLKQLESNEGSTEITKRLQVMQADYERQKQDMELELNILAADNTSLRKQALEREGLEKKLAKLSNAHEELKRENGGLYEKCSSLEDSLDKICRVLAVEDLAAAMHKIPTLVDARRRKDVEEFHEQTRRVNELEEALSKVLSDPSPLFKNSESAQELRAAVEECKRQILEKDDVMREMLFQLRESERTQEEMKLTLLKTHAVLKQRELELSEQRSQTAELEMKCVELAEYIAGMDRTHASLQKALLEMQSRSAAFNSQVEERVRKEAEDGNELIRSNLSDMEQRFLQERERCLLIDRQIQELKSSLEREGDEKRLAHELLKLEKEQHKASRDKCISLATDLERVSHAAGKSASLESELGNLKSQNAELMLQVQRLEHRTGSPQQMVTTMLVREREDELTDSQARLHALEAQLLKEEMRNRTERHELLSQIGEMRGALAVKEAEVAQVIRYFQEVQNGQPRSATPEQTLTSDGKIEMWKHQLEQLVDALENDESSAALDGQSNLADEVSAARVHDLMGDVTVLQNELLAAEKKLNDKEKEIEALQLMLLRQQQSGGVEVQKEYEAIVRELQQAGESKSARIQKLQAQVKALQKHVEAQNEWSERMNTYRQMVDDFHRQLGLQDGRLPLFPETGESPRYGQSATSDNSSPSVHSRTASASPNGQDPAPVRPSVRVSTRDESVQMSVRQSSQNSDEGTHVTLRRTESRDEGVQMTACRRSEVCTEGYLEGGRDDFSDEGVKKTIRRTPLPESEGLPPASIRGESSPSLWAVRIPIRDTPADSPDSIRYSSMCDNELPACVSNSLGDGAVSGANRDHDKSSGASKPSPSLAPLTDPRVPADNNSRIDQGRSPTPSTRLPSVLSTSQSPASMAFNDILRAQSPALSSNHATPRQGLASPSPSVLGISPLQNGQGINQRPASTSSLSPGSNVMFRVSKLSPKPSGDEQRKAGSNTPEIVAIVDHYDENTIHCIPVLTSSSVSPAVQSAAVAAVAQYKAQQRVQGMR